MKPFVLVAAAAMALASCQKSEMPAPEKQDVHFTVNAGIETKTSIVEGKDGEGNTLYTPQWDGNEELGILLTAPGKDTEAKDVAKLTNSESGSKASFQGNLTVDETEGTFYAFYPASAFNRGYEEGDARLDLKNVQKPTATSFDPTCDILVAKPYDYVVEDGAVVADGLQFARIMSVLRIDLNSEFADVQNEFVESVSFTAGDVKITGYARIFLDNPKFDKWASSGNQWCTVTANYDSELVSINGESKSVYLVIAPVTIPENKDLTFEIKTKNYNISKTVKSPEMKFTAGNVSKINLTIEEENCEKIDMSVDYSGEYLIVNTDLTKAASKWANGNNLPAVALQSENGVVYETDNLADCKMTIAKVTEGDNAGKYTIQDAAGKYLYAAGGTGNNHLKGQDATSYWTIEEKDGNYVITSTVANCTRNLLRYNSQNNLFSCYASGQNDVTLYKYSDLVPDTRPKLEIATETLNLESDASIGTIDVTVKNITSVAVRALTAKDAQDEVNWLTVTYSNGVISYSATANVSEEARTAYIEAYASDDLKDGVTVTQAGKTAANTPVEYTVKYTVATTSSVTTSGDAPVGSSTTFKNTYTTKEQMTKNNSQTYTLSGFKGCVIKKVTLSMKSNASAGTGTFSMKAGSTTLASISSATAFNKWFDNTSYGSSYRDVHVTLTNSDYVVADENVVIVIAATVNSLYCQSVEVTYETSNSGSGSENPDPDLPGDGGETPDGPVVVLSEQFDNSTTADSSTAINDSKFPNFSGETSKAYTSKYGGIKLGSSSAVGYITSKALDLSSAFTVQIDACKYGSDTGNIVVTVGSQSLIINNSELGAAGTFKTFTLTFDAATSSSTVKIATSSKRAYIDNVAITRN